MEATQVNISNGLEIVADSVGIGDQFIEDSAGPTAASNSEFCIDLMVATSKNKSHSNMGDQNLQDNSVHPGGVQVPASSPGVSNCYVFKSRLQEYAQKVGIPTPVYQTIKEGPSHEPSFRSTVIVDGERYESLPGFFNRKAAEQSAAEVALMELSKSGEKKDSIAVPVHETGLCKNLLQEYAQKMNYAIPTYICRKDDTPGRTPLFSCTVDIGGIQYIGAAARTKKEAEIKAARTALLAIRSSAAIGDSEPKYSVVPAKRKMPETALLQVKSVKAKKQKKPRLKKKRNKPPCQSRAGIVGILGAPIAFQVPNHGLMHACTTSSDLDKRPLKNTLLNGEASVVKIDCGPQVGMVNFDKIQQTTFNGQLGELKVPSVESSVTLVDPNIIQEESSVHHIGYSMIEKSPLSGALESLPLDSSEDPANHLEEEKHRPTNTV